MEMFVKNPQHFNSSVCYLLIYICFSHLMHECELKLTCGTVKRSRPMIVCRTEGLGVLKTELATF